MVLNGVDPAIARVQGGAYRQDQTTKRRTGAPARLTEARITTVSMPSSSSPRNSNAWFTNTVLAIATLIAAQPFSTAILAHTSDG
jgi:hypothetical protein